MKDMKVPKAKPAFIPYGKGMKPGAKPDMKMSVKKTKSKK